MSELDSAGATGAGGSVESSNGGTSYGADLAIQSVKDRAFQAMAKPDDATDFIKESREREAEERGDPEVHTPHRKHARLDRIKRAVEAANKAGESILERRDGRTPEPQEGLDGQGNDDAEADWNRERDAIYHTAQHQLRAAEFARSQPDYHDLVGSVLSIYQPAEHIAGALLRSPVGPQLTYELAREPEVVEMLNSLPEAEAIRRLAIAEGALIARASIAHQQQPPPRKASRAPPPMRGLSGGSSSPPADEASLAKKDDATDLIRHWRRRAQ